MDERAATDLLEWRRRKRKELIARREGLPAHIRRRSSMLISSLLKRGFRALEAMTIGFCWPYRGEVDTRFAVRHFREKGARSALPVVVGKGRPLEFRLWWPGAPVTAGVFGLPTPQGTATVRPDAILMPPVAFDRQGYRLGYGGGFFDRTLAEHHPQPLKIGVAHECSRIETIFPQAHDVPMDFVVTEAGVHYATPSGLALIEDMDAVEELVATLCASRSLAHQRREGAYERA